VTFLLLVFDLLNVVFDSLSVKSYALLYLTRSGGLVSWSLGLENRPRITLALERVIVKRSL
jgi:hypothetical protein